MMGTQPASSRSGSGIAMNAPAAAPASISSKSGDGSHVPSSSEARSELGPVVGLDIFMGVRLS